MNFAMDLDSPVVAWQARVVDELAARAQQVVVLTERLGRIGALPNVEVHEIPRRPLGVPQRIGGGILYNPRALSILRRHRPDVCFIHMAHQWTYRLAPTFFLTRIPVLLWYAHGTVTRRLRISHLLADSVVTSSPEGFRIPSEKVIVIGQGIDVELYSLRVAQQQRNEIVYVGRISRRKRIHLLLRGVEEFCRNRPELPVRVRLIGPTLTADDRSYVRELQGQSSTMTVEVRFEGSVPPAELPFAYDDAFVHLSLSETGSMDKTILESLARGVPVITSNVAFRDLLRLYPEFVLHEDIPHSIACALDAVYSKQTDYDPAELRALVIGNHDLQSYANRLHAHLTYLASKGG